MEHAPAPRPPTPVRVVVEDVADLDDRVAGAARRARECDRAVELVQPYVAECDHEARAALIRRMDAALAVARRAAPGVEIRVGERTEVPPPHRAP